MKVKRYVATDIQEAMLKIKNELGEDAVILHTRYFKEGGILGLFKKNFVEVTAAIDDTKVSFQLNAVNNGPIKEIASETHTINNLRKEIEKHRQYHITKEVEKEQNLTNESYYDIIQKIEEKDPVANFPRIGKNLYELLRKQEVEERIAKKIVKETLQQITLQNGLNKEHYDSIFEAILLKQIKKCKPIDISKGAYKKPKIFALVGPTGVGKTTTIAKLAAKLAILEQKKVAFITIDTYRIAAVEQLKTIGDIMNVPVNVIYSLDQINKCIMELSNNDIIFIDTAGRSHKNAQQMEELKTYLEIANVDDIFLVLSSTSKYQDLLDIFKAYKSFNIKRLIITKLDETSYYGTVYNIACQSKYSLAYFTNGQNIPDDIEAADAENIVKLIMKE